MKLHVAIVFALCAAVAGCSDSNVPAGTPHAHGKAWVTTGPVFHGIEFRDGTIDCLKCHEIDSYCVKCHFDPTQEDVRVPPGSGWRHPDPPGDPTGLSHRELVAFGQTCNTCHQVVRSYGVGPSPCHDCHGTPDAGHPLPFKDPALHGPPAKADLPFCQACHADQGDNPRFDAAVGDLPKGCETCHNDRTAHPSTGDRDNQHWYGVYGHDDAGKLAEACTLCHGAALNGVGGVGPSCTSCHGTSPLVDVNCTSCHGKPPSGASSPNRAGAHETHKELVEIGTVCDTCHSGAGNRTAQHFDGEVQVTAPSEYDAKSGAAAFSNDTCTNVSCHGGQVTPSWLSGTIDVPVDCKKCHSLGTSQYNSYHSGLHELHTVTLGLFCTNCHNPVKLADRHFTNLKTPILEGVPSASLGGGITHVAVYSAGSCTPTDAVGCHGTKTWGAPHPTDGSFIAPSQHGAAAKAQEFTYCQECHASPGISGVGTNPRFNVTIGNLPAGCETCHNDRAAHPSAGSRDSQHWYGVYHHDDTQNQTVACALCHGASLDGVGGVGPSCTSCHTAGSPLIALNCTSCHGRPPSGAASPNRAGGHGPHNTLAKVTGVCDTCHNGAGNHTALHKNGTPNVSVLATYNAKTGTPSYSSSSRSCANVSCHGGQSSPAWLTETLDVNTSCTRCHRAGTTQFNSFNSGQHTLHVTGENIACTQCHNTATLAINHFTNLDTPAMEGPASATVGGGATRVNSYVNGRCSPQCHGSDDW